MTSSASCPCRPASPSSPATLSAKTRSATGSPSEAIPGRAATAWQRVLDAVKDYVGESLYPCKTTDDLDSVELRHAWGARYSAPGYLDCTDWCLGETEEEAVQECKDLYGDDEDEQESDDDGFLAPDSDTTANGVRTCVWTVELPDDLHPTVEKMCQYAIDYVRESAPDYCMPANWTACFTDGKYQVTRQSPA
jgi:hypothetical protein